MKKSIVEGASSQDKLNALTDVYEDKLAKGKKIKKKVKAFRKRQMISEDKPVPKKSEYED